MRRQYHSRQVDGQRLIWDVHRLIELSRNLPVQQIALSEIAELDEPFWFEEEAKPLCREIALHAKLIMETDLAYPIIRSSNGRVMDGMHRVCKAWLEDRPTIAAVQFQHDPAPDYVDADLDELPYDELW
ncbi:MAG: hypothetical protein HYR56_21020 [Acidobacteria bacterium]|nr:hypothetical protein [Acidobacteriota bacterium]MBI3427443.1 hypothetical protein [Acidobacteriota bacterium]